MQSISTDANKIHSQNIKKLAFLASTTRYQLLLIISFLGVSIWWHVHVIVGFLTGTGFVEQYGLSWKAATTIRSGDSIPISSQLWALEDKHNETGEVKTATPYANCQHRQEGNSTYYCLPKAIIGGAMKCGTNDAGALIVLHPRTRLKLCPAFHKCKPDEYQGRMERKTNETFLWETRPWWLLEGKINQFMDRFPVTDGIHTMNIDKSPQFLDTTRHPSYPQLANRYLPGVKFIFTLCDPAERVASTFFHNQRDSRLQKAWKTKFERVGFNNSPTTFPDFVTLLLDSNNNNNSTTCSGKKRETKCKLLLDSFLTPGIYTHHIMDWLQIYSRSDLLILEMKESRAEKARKMIDFMDLPVDEYPWDLLADEENINSYTNVNVANYNGRDLLWKEYPETMKKLSYFYAKHNTKLADLLHVDFPLRWRSTHFFEN